MKTRARGRRKGAPQQLWAQPLAALAIPEFSSFGARNPLATTTSLPRPHHLHTPSHRHRRLGVGACTLHRHPSTCPTHATTDLNPGSSSRCHLVEPDRASRRVLLSTYQAPPSHACHSTRRLDAMHAQCEYLLPRPQAQNTLGSCASIAPGSAAIPPLSSRLGAEAEPAAG
jgi:hypothetical protein